MEKTELLPSEIVPIYLLCLKVEATNTVNRIVAAIDQKVFFSSLGQCKELHSLY